MRKLIFILLGIISIAYGQDTIKYTPMTAAGYQAKYFKADSLITVPFLDTTLRRGTRQPGSLVMRPQDSIIYIWNGRLWSAIGTGASTTTIINYIIDSSIVINYFNTYTGVDSVTYDTATGLMCIHPHLAAQICYEISTDAPPVTTGVDSVVIDGNELCQYSGGVPTCYTITNTINEYITNVFNTINNPACNPRWLSGSVVVDSLFVGRNTDIQFQINCRDYFAAASVFNLPGSTTLPFYVGIYADTLGNIGKIVGGTNPLEIPTLIDDQSQILLKIYLIPAFSTTPEGVSTEWVYREGDDEYWLDNIGTISALYFDSVSTATYPLNGIHSLRLSRMQLSNQYHEWQDGSTHSSTAFTDLTANIRLSGTFPKTLGWRISLYLDNSLATSNSVLIADGLNGYSRTDTGYQFIGIKMSDFNFILPTFNKIRVTGIGSTNNAHQWDDVRLQKDAPPVNTDGFVRSVRGVFGEHVEFAVGDTLELSGDSSNYYLKDKRTGLTLASVPTFLTYLRSADTCLVIDTIDAKNFVISFNQFCGGSGGSGTVESVVAGTNITVDNTDPANPIVSATGSGGTTSTQSLTATAAQTAFTFTSVPASYDDYWIEVNGAVVSQTYYSTSGNIVTFTGGLVAGDVVIFHRTQ